MNEDRPVEPEGGKDWEARRAALGAKLREHEVRREAEARAESGSGGSMRGMAQGLKVASEFVSGIAVGALLGYGIDYVFGTGPFALVIFLFLGFAAGVLNVVRGSAPSRQGTGKGSD